MIEIALRNALLLSPEVRSLLGDRVYPLAAPENTAFPCVVYARRSTEREYHMSGSCGEAKATVELAILATPRATADQYYELKKLAGYVRQQLDGYTQRDPASQVTGATRIKYVQITAESDDVFAPAHDEGEDSMGVSLTLEVAFSEPASKYLNG